MPFPVGGGGGNKPWWVVLEPVSARLGVDHRVVMHEPIPPGDTKLAGPFATKAEATNALVHKVTQHGSFPNPLDIFHGLDLGSLLIRVGEVLLGIVLIGVGIARITGVENAVSSAVKNIKVVPI